MPFSPGRDRYRAGREGFHWKLLAATARQAECSRPEEVRTVLTRGTSLAAAALAVALFAGTGRAQAPPRDSGDSVKKLEAELQRLRAQVKEAEARLRKAKEAAKGTKADGARKGKKAG